MNEPLTARTHCYVYNEETGVADQCPMLRVHDRHYFYCRALGDQSKPDMDPHNGGMKQILNIYLEVLPGCPYAKDCGNRERTSATTR